MLELIASTRYGEPKGELRCRFLTMRGFGRPGARPTREMWKIPFYRHDLGPPEIQAVADVLAGPILTTGDTVKEFETRFASLLGRNHALGVTSCTGALHMALMALDIGPGDEVITTPMSFIATATAIVEAGAAPVFVDVEEDTGNLNAALVEAAITPKTKAILPVHLFGLMCDMRRLKSIADGHGLHIIEDAAHCVEGERDGIRPGQASAAACFSFYATKVLTCGEGGAIVTDDDGLHERLRLLSHHGMTKIANDRYREGYTHWDMATFGWKYNMSNVQAALLLPQFDRVDEKLRNRQALAALYRKRLEGTEGVRIPRSRDDACHAHHLFTAWIEGGNRDQLMAALRERGIECVVNYLPIHLMSYFRERFGFDQGAFPVAELIGEQTLSLPFYPTMPEQSVDTVAEAISEILGSP